MKRKLFIILAASVFGLLGIVGLGAAHEAEAQGQPGCVAGGHGYVGPASSVPTADPVFISIHASYEIGLCGGGDPQDGDTSIQYIRYADGTTEWYKIVFSTQDLTAMQGAYCYWNLDSDSYHCAGGSANDDLKMFIVSSAGDSPYLEPYTTTNVEWRSRPNGLGIGK